MKKHRFTPLAFVVSAALGGCAQQSAPPPASPGDDEPQPPATNVKPDGGKAAAPDMASPSLPADGPEPGRAAPPDAAAPRDTGGPLASDAATSPPSGDAGATPSADAGPAGVGTRVSLHDDLVARWTGERKSMTMEGGTTIFTGVFNANEFGGPQGHNVRLKISPGREYLFEYRIRFDGNFPFSRGGKIPGLAGASAPTGCVTVTGTGFSARMMWRENGKLIGYTYDIDQSTECGNAIQTGFNFTPNQWHSMKERVKLNTGRNHDGILQVWVDDRMVINRSNMAWMNETATNRIDVVLFHSFFGGSTQDWAPSRQCSISFADPYVTKLGE